MSSTSDLFPDIAGIRLRDDLTHLFDDWIAARAQSSSLAKSHRPLREDSIDVYRDMWLEFVNWCVERSVALSKIDTADLVAFLDSLGRGREASDRYAKRMLRLLQRLDHWECQRRGRPANVAFESVSSIPRYRFAGSRSDDSLPEYLTSSQARALMLYVTQRSANVGIDGAWTWQDVRNRTAIAVQLGGGITPGESRDLTLEQIVVEGGKSQGEPWALRLPGNGNFSARDTPLAGWAGKQLAYWLELRGRLSIPGMSAFPSTKTGKAWAKSPSIRAFQEVLAAAGVPTAGGSFKLRHTFVLRQLTRFPSEQVAKWIGVEDPAVMARYQRVLFEPVEVV